MYQGPVVLLGQEFGVISKQSVQDGELFLSGLQEEVSVLKGDDHPTVLPTPWSSEDGSVYQVSQGVPRGLRVEYNLGGCRCAFAYISGCNVLGNIFVN